MTVIRQSTARTILVGPVLDEDGVAKVNEVVANIRITKNGTVGGAHGSTTLAHNHAGKYRLLMDAGDSDTVGVLQISLDSGTNDMPLVNLDVVEEVVYDRDYVAAATGNTASVIAILADTDELQADDIPGTLATILADTDELQTDWTDGGRLDLLLDEVASIDGAGSVTCNVYTRTGAGNPIDGVDVWITSDAAGTNVTAGTLTSDDAGLTTFYLDAGTHYLWRQLAGYMFTNPQTMTV